MEYNQAILFSQADGVATITLNRPDCLNAMNHDLMAMLLQTMEAVKADTSIRVLILKGAGKSFCSGADLTSGLDPASEEFRELNKVFTQAVVALVESPVPTVARVTGAAAGGGMSLALACDITIAAESAFFMAPFGPKLGIIPDMGCSWNLPRRVGRARALGISLLGERFSARQAEDWGLIWKCVGDEVLDSTVANIADNLKNTSPKAAIRTRQLIDSAYSSPFDEHLQIENKSLLELAPRNFAEGAQAFVEKRTAVFSDERDQ